MATTFNDVAQKAESQSYLPRLLLGITNSQELALAGKENLQYILQGLRQDEKQVSESVADAAKKLALIEGKTPESISRDADYGVDLANLLADMPIPDAAKKSGRMDEERVHYGHTSFIRCGDCKHWSSKGSGVSCIFLRGFIPSQQAPYESPCLVRNLSSEEFNRMVNYGERELRQTKTRRDLIRNQIKRVQKAIAVAETRPLFPNFRGKEYMRYGDPVVVYTHAPNFGSLRWIPAVALRANIVCLEEPLVPLPYQHPRTFKEWRSFIWHDDSDTYRCPFILREWEFDYLATIPPNDPFRILWLNEVDHEWTYERHGGRSSTYTVDMTTFAKRLHLRYKTNRNGLGLMTTQRAERILGFIQPPATQEEVVARFRNLVEMTKFNEDPNLYRRAKDTLLLRFQGSWFDSDF